MYWQHHNSSSFTLAVVSPRPPSVLVVLFSPFLLKQSVGRFRLDFSTRGIEGRIAWPLRFLAGFPDHLKPVDAIRSVREIWPVSWPNTINLLYLPVDQESRWSNHITVNPVFLSLVKKKLRKNMTLLEFHVVYLLSKSQCSPRRKTMAPSFLLERGG